MAEVFEILVVLGYVNHVYDLNWSYVDLQVIVVQFFNLSNGNQFGFYVIIGIKE